MRQPSLAYLRTLLDFDPATGEFRWKVSRSRTAKAGNLAGTVDLQGYVIIGVDRRYHKAHRLAFLFANGRWPSGVVDHINRVKTDNRPQNLRDVTQAQNSRNQAKSKNNRSGFKGVHWHNRLGRWCASIRVNRRLLHLGYFHTAIEAARAYDAASHIYHGEFGRQSTAMLNPVKQGEVA